MDNTASSPDYVLLTSCPGVIPKVPPKARKTAECLGLGNRLPADVTETTEFSKIGAIVMDGHQITPADAGVTGPTPPPARLEREPPEMFERFAFWCTAPDRDERRSWAAVGQRFNIDPATVRTQAQRYDWVARSIEWDRKRVLGALQKASELQASAAVSHVSLAQELTDQAHRALRQCEVLLEGEIDLEVVEAWQRMASGISKILEKAQKAARLALGQSGANVSVKVETKSAAPELDHSRLSDAEFQLLIAAETLRAVRAEGDGRGPLPADVRALLTFISGKAA